MDSFVKRLLTERDRLAELDVDADRLAEALSGEDSELIAALCISASALPGQSAHDVDPVALLNDADTEASYLRRLAVCSTLEVAGVDDHIDGKLEHSDDPSGMIDALLRAGTDWYHPALVDAIDDDDSRFGAACLLSRTAPDELEEAMTDLETTPNLLETLRAVALFGDDDWYGALRQWRDHLVDDDIDDRTLSRLDGVLATVAPERYAQALLMGQLDDGWLSDDRAVADFLTVHGTSEWSSTLAVFRHVRDTRAFELAAAFAAAAAMAYRFDDVDNTDRLAPDNAGDWIAEEPTKVAFQLAISDDDELAQLLVEATLHQALIRRGIQPPAMTGLPLSGHPPESGDLDERLDLLRQLSMDPPGERVQVVRTLNDLRQLAEEGAIETSQATSVLEDFSSAGDAPQLVATAFGDADSIGRFDDWGCRGLEALTIQFRRPTDAALAAVADGWFDAPVERTAVYRAAFDALLDVFDDNR